MSTAALEFQNHTSMAAAESTSARSWGIALIRAIVGIVFLIHGGQKLLVFGVDNVAGMMAHLGIPFPVLSAYMVTTVEFLGGAALLLGLFSRAAAILLAVDMLVAMVKVHFKGGFFLPAGYEYALTLFALNVALLITGPGALAIENALFGRRS